MNFCFYHSFLNENKKFRNRLSKDLKIKYLPDRFRGCFLFMVLLWQLDFRLFVHHVPKNKSWFVHLFKNTNVLFRKTVYVQAYGYTYNRSSLLWIITSQLILFFIVLKMIGTFWILAFWYVAFVLALLFIFTTLAIKFRVYVSAKQILELG